MTWPKLPKLWKWVLRKDGRWMRLPDNAVLLTLNICGGVKPYRVKTFFLAK